MKFPSVNLAQEWSTAHGRHIFVEIDGAEGVLEVWPGGRKIFRAADLGKIYERYRRRLTPDEVFSAFEEATMKMSTESIKMYLGDSVYVEIIDGMLKLTTENGYSDDPSNTIFLEYETFKSLERYVEQNIERIG
jgi:hypothetical protein